MNIETKPLVRQRVDDWLAAFSPGEKKVNFTDLEQLYWRENELLTYDTLSPVSTIISGWQSFEQVWKPFLNNLSAWRIELVGDPKFFDSPELTVAALVFHGVGRTEVGEAVDVTAHATLVWLWRQGVWRIIHEHVSHPVRL